MLEKEIFDIRSEEDFNKIALQVFQFQYDQLPIYRTYCDALKIDVQKVDSIEKIPFLPIQFFKTEKVILQNKTPKLTFESSGTTGTVTSKHLVAQPELYTNSYLKGFETMYGPVCDITIIALLPSYLERGNSSLVYMVNDLIERSDFAESNFYLQDPSELKKLLLRLESAQQKTLLIGVSYALLDLIEAHTFQLKHTIVMETGGMKGRRKEMVKEELHAHLKAGFGVPQIHSEYGMTELLSQAYSQGEGVFSCPPWMRILTRDPEDPLQLVEGKTGGINVIDLANLYSCSFIATQDLGKVYQDRRFEIMGRFDASDIRGCNLMIQ